MSSTTTTPIRLPNTPAASSGSPDSTALPRVQHTHANGDAAQAAAAAAAAARRSSFGFLRRKSSSETRPGQRSASGGKMSKKQRALAQEEALRKQREAAMLPKQPPRLPSHSPLPQIDNFGGYGDRPDSIAIVSGKAGAYRSNFSRPSLDSKMASNTPAAYNVAAQPPPVPGSSPSYMDFDPYPPTESMANRGRYSYASSAVSAVNSPRRVRRRKDPTPFNILVIGGKGCGKTSFIEFLRSALALPAKKRTHMQSPPSSAGSIDSPFISEYIESEFDGERVGVTLWDSQGLEKSIVDFQLPVITAFLESKFEDTFTEEQKVVRSPGAKDTHIHCVFLILDPARLTANLTEAHKKPSAKRHIIGGLDEDLDLSVLRELQNKTTVIPVISKADTITTAHMRHLKKMVWDTIKRSKLDPLEALNLDENDEDEDDDDLLDERDEDAYVQSDTEGTTSRANKLNRSSSEAGSESDSLGSHSPPTSPPSARKNHMRKPSAMSACIQKDADPEMPYLPLSIISPDPYEPEVIGRRFPWGFADPYNIAHCDFVRLRESVFSEWRSELREASREQWYEGWRTNRLQRGPARRTVTADGPSKQQLTVPATNGRAASAGTRDTCQTRNPNFYA